PMLAALRRASRRVKEFEDVKVLVVFHEPRTKASAKQCHIDRFSVAMSQRISLYADFILWSESAQINAAVSCNIAASVSRSVKPTGSANADTRRLACPIVPGHLACTAPPADTTRYKVRRAHRAPYSPARSARSSKS